MNQLNSFQNSNIEDIRSNLFKLYVVLMESLLKKNSNIQEIFSPIGFSVGVGVRLFKKNSNNLNLVFLSDDLDYLKGLIPNGHEELAMLSVNYKIFQSLGKYFRISRHNGKIISHYEEPMNK